MTQQDQTRIIRDLHGDYFLLTIAKQIIAEKFEKGRALSSPEKAKIRLIHEFANDTEERFVAMFLNTKHQILSIETLFTGTIDQCAVYPRTLAKLALAHNAAAVIVSHNHPSGNPEPSRADIHITDKIKSALSLLDIKLLDHIVVGGTETCSLAELGHC